MREEDKTYELIEEYLNSQLSDSDRVAFEKELQTNPDLQHQLNLHKFTNELVIENRLLDVKEILLEQKSTGGKSVWKFIVGGLAGALVLTGILLFSQQDKTKPSKKETITNTSKPDSQISMDNKAPEEQVPSEKTEDVTTKKKEKSTAPKSNASSESTISTEEHTPFDPGTINIIETEKQPEPVKEENKTVPVNPADPCFNTNIIANVSANSACSGEEDGAILVNGFKGGHSPYNVLVYDNHNELKSAPLSLSAGTYNVEIKDSKGCIKKYEQIVVPKKDCPKDFHFNPFIGQTWSIPVGTQDGKLVIHNDRGAVAFEKDIHAGAEEHWSGESKNGEINSGFYIFVIKYKDGSQLQGSVSIVK